MATWADPTRPSPAGSRPAYLAHEVDAWAEAAAVSESRLRAELVDASAGSWRMESQIRLVVEARQAIDLASARAATTLGPSVPDACRQVLDEARNGALAVLASACRQIADLSRAWMSTKDPESVWDGAVTVPSVPDDRVRLSFTSSPRLGSERAYLVEDGDRYMDTISSTVESLRVELETAEARADDAESRFFDLAAGLSVRSTTGESDVATTIGPPPTELDLHALLAATGREALEVIAVARQAIAGLYGHAEIDLRDPTPGPWVGEQQPA